jgi:type I restriction enzyme S subunit
VALSAGGAQPNISQQIIKDFKIPLPSLEVQNQIANEFAEEQEIVESNTKLISIYEQKIQQTLSAIWVA